MGKRRVAISSELVRSWITTGSEFGFDGYGLRCLEGVPITAVFETSYMDWERGVQYLIFSDDSWDGPEPGTRIPEIYVTWQKEHIPDIVPLVPVGPTSYGPMAPPIGATVHKERLTTEELEQMIARAEKHL